MCLLKVFRPMAVIFPKRYRPDVGLLTSEPPNNDDELNPRIIAPDPFEPDDCLDVFSAENRLLLTKIEVENIMNKSEDEFGSSAGLNARLRPRRSTVVSPHTNKIIRKPEPKNALDRQKRTSTPSKASSTKPDDLANKSDSSNAPQLLCPYCDRKFASKQTVSQHARRVHLSPKQDALIDCLFCNHAEPDSNDIIRHMVDSHPNQYFACLDCHTRFSSTSELAEHKLNICEKQKVPYRSKLRQKVSSGSKKNQNLLNIDDKGFTIDGKDFPDGHRFNGVVISCELKPSQGRDEEDIEDNITTNLILPPSKNLGSTAAMEKNAVIVLDDIQWNKRMPANFSFHNTDADQILSRLGVVHRSPRTGESTKKEWFKCAEEATQKFEKCFDTSFYSKVASNVHENMSKFLDGSFNFNPDPDSIIKTRKSKYSVIINAAEGFPILLACEQYSRSVFDGYMPRALAPKHKWKWENEKAPLNPDDIKHDTHVNNCIITLVSSLDIWTQLCMRRKFEDKMGIPPLEKKSQKQNTISKQLKEILESRELPSTSKQVVKFINKPISSGDSLDFPASLGLKPSAPTFDMQPAVLSGEWVRPRCYVCCACGAQTRDSRGLSSHITTQHPNAQVQHYEIVGELLLNADILKHLYVPPSQISNRTRPLRGFRECTKCKKSISLEDLHQHMLDCAGDTPAVRRKCRYRPFGVRRRRTRLPDNTIRKKIRKDIRTRQTRQKALMRSRPKIRSEVGDAETIRKMLADLPPKRHRVLVNPMNPILRPRRKLDQQRNKLILRRRSSDILKNRKQRNLKGNGLSRIGSNSGDNDDNDSKCNHKSDDENKPMKPKVKKIKITYSTRQSESLKRKVALNRAKRRAQIKDQKAIEDKPEQPVDVNPSASSNGDQVEQSSLDNSPERVDVNSGPYNTREQSSRGRSNKSDDQRPGPSNQDGDTHKIYVPPENDPLNHSITRLTGEHIKEIRDVSNIDLSLFRVFQIPECNEVAQHVPSEQRRLFENEAVVTKLDKPPLHFNLGDPGDPYKGKHCTTSNNKRKGLNDCIAMLKNKAGQTAETSDAVPCNSEDRLNSEIGVTNEKSPNLDLQMNMNYDINTRPAEIYSRHPFISDMFMEYRPENNPFPQNFSELSMQYLPSPRIAFDLPQPDNMIDPRFVKPSRKQNEGNQKTTRRRSARTEKEQMKRQDYTLRTSSGHYPVSVSTPSKVTTTHSRRASTQSVARVTNTAVSKRRSSVSYNQNRKTVNDYRTEAMMISHPRPLEYHPHRILPETHLIELNHSEAYIEAQNNLQKQMIACAENYMNPNQLAICVDPNYPYNTPNALSPEAVYLSSKQAISPGNDYINKKQAAVGSDLVKRKRGTSSVESNYMVKKQISNAIKTKYYNKKQSACNNESVYNKAYASRSHESDIINQAQAALYVESTYMNKKAKAVENNSSNNAHAVACNESFINKTYAVGTESNFVNRTQTVTPVENNFVNMASHDVNETNFATKKITSVASETNFTPNKSPVMSQDSNFITKKRAAISESRAAAKKELTTSDSTSSNMRTEASSEVTVINKNQGASSDSLPESAVKLLSSTESSFVTNTHPIQATGFNISEKRLSDVLEQTYADISFNNIPIIPSAYPTMSGSFELSRHVIEAPLDLSKSTSNKNPEVLNETPYPSENYDSYVTLDLSHKHSEDNNDVVDLRVKGISTTTAFDMSCKLQSNDDMDSVTDLSIKIRDNDTPTDLTIKNKTNNNTYEYDSRNVNYDDIPKFVQDLRKTHQEDHQSIALSLNISDSNIPTDFSGRIGEEPLNMVAIKSPGIQTNLEQIEIFKQADLTVGEQPKQNALSPITDLIECVLPTTAEESGLVTKNICDAEINQPITTSVTSVTATEPATKVTETVRSSNVVSSHLVMSEENIVVNTINNISPDVLTTILTATSNTISSVASSIPFCTESKTLVHLSTSKHESTDPVYTLANSCISTTKIKPLNAVPLTEAILSTPNNTIANASSVYTLTDTIVNTKIYHHEKSSQDAIPATKDSIDKTRITTDSIMSVEKHICMSSVLPVSTSSADEHNKERSSQIGDLDPETAKKIAMLPKELVEILGTMPVGHRNQLLNVLPQYVSTPAPRSQNEVPNKPAAAITSVVNMLSPPRISDSEVKPALVQSPVSSSQSICAPAFTQPTIASVACAVNVEETKPILHHQTAGEPLPLDADVDKKDVSLPLLYDVGGNTVIDLTEDEPVNADSKKITLEPNNVEIIPSNELGGVAPNNKSNKQKVNDQTASLRAVRIKAPSERKKSLSTNVMLTVSKKSSQEKQTKANELHTQNLDIGVNIDKTMAIQQAEISSTQHNTTTAGKSPIVKSPSCTVFSRDELNKHIAQPSLNIVSEIVPKIIEERNGEISVPKPGSVTSSIIKNDINLTNVDNNLNTIIDTNTKALTKSCEVATNNSLLIQNSKEGSPNCGVSDLNAAENRYVEGSISCTKEPEYEEDSEDDLSLAAIIKQKLGDQVKVGENNVKEEKTNQQTNKKKKKARKSKKVTKKLARDDIFQEIYLNEPKVSPVLNCDKSSLKNIIDLHSDTNYQLSATPEGIDKNKHSKNCPDVFLPVINIQLDEALTIEGDKEITKENDVDSIFINTLIDNDNSIPVDVKDDIKESPPHSHASEEIQNEVSKIKTKQKVNKEFPSDKDLIVRFKNLSDSADKDEAEQIVTTASEFSKNECDIVPKLMATDALNPQFESDQKNHDGSVILNSPDEKHDKIEMITHEVDVNQPILDGDDIKENSKNVTALRRSRRGKSLFSCSALTDTDLYEISSEQKTPLTKKQLIFSKLRLDEETPSPSAHSTPQKQRTIEYESQNSEVEKTINLHQLRNVENPSEISEEKSKGTKRRINSHLTKKSKKKKSIEEQNITDKEPTSNYVESIPLGVDNLTLIQNDCKKIQPVSSNELNVTSNKKTSEINLALDSPVLSSKHNSDKDSMSPEKRKISNPISFDLSHSSKPKKCKMSKGNKNVDSEWENVNLTYNKTEETVTGIIAETKTACYNLQIPARRGRSKSAVVKSSGAEMYDPYDIDLEDMAEHNESIKRKQYTGKNIRKKAVKPAIKESIKAKSDDLKCNQIFDTQQDTNVISSDDNDIIDSDDSSKSDVPLQWYLDKKEKKEQESEPGPKQTNSKINHDETKNSNEHITKRSSSPDKIVDITQTEDEQELQSQKFFGSFGFFSEKKPRKSNLLATKKISETINITNESDDRYFGFKERYSKRNKKTKSKKSSDTELSKPQPQPSTSKKVVAKRGRKKKKDGRKMIVMPRYCEICRKEFRRSDNYLKHSMRSLLHFAKLLEVELKVKSIPVQDVPNYFIAYRIIMKRYKRLLDRLSTLKKRNAKAAAKIPLPTHKEILKEVQQTIEELEVTKGLSKDEVLFLNCCKLLKSANKGRNGSALDNFKNALDEEDAKLRECVDDDVDSLTAKNILESEEVRNLENDLISGLKEAAMATRLSIINQERTNDFPIGQSSKAQEAMPEVAMNQVASLEVALPEVEMQEMAIPEVITSLTDPDVLINKVVQEHQVVHVDQTMEVARNIDLTQDIKEKDFHEMLESKSKESNELISTTATAECQYDNMKDVDVPAKSKAAKAKKQVEVKEKMYPDVLEDIDMFEDKFDKIKRKCRSQAAAAKQPQPIVERTTSNKGKRKTEKKKVKRSSKKTIYQNTQVPTKGALKGFDGFKVSIPTSDINLSGIVPVYQNLPKKKKKSGSKRKKDKSDPELSGKYDNEHRVTDISINRNVDVYEFMDNEDAELFEFRPSTVMERFKNISFKKNIPSTSKVNTVAEDDNSSEISASDGDDFVYMSDDYVCSDEETENSLMSCEMSNVKIGNDVKKISAQKRKDVVEKNAVMEKIFKHNAVRTEKKLPTIKEPAKAKASLDQLFDSLLEEEPNSSLLNSDAVSPNVDDDLKAKYSQSSKYDTSSAIPYDQKSIDDTFVSPQEPYFSSPENSDIISPGTSKRRNSSPLKDNAFKKHNTKASIKYDLLDVNYGPSSSEKYDDSVIDYGPSTSKKYDHLLLTDYKDLSPKKYDSVSLDKYEEKFKHHEPKTKKRTNSTSCKRDDDTFRPYDEDLKSPASKPDEGIGTSFDFNNEIYYQSMLDDSGVVRQRARRKCTVGKQNVLSELWSSESEIDGGPPRPNSAESVISCVGRKKKGRKKDGQQATGRRGNSRHIGYKKQDIESRVSNSRSGSSSASGSGSVAQVRVQSVEEGNSSVGSEAAAEAAVSTNASDNAAAAAMPAPSTSHAHVHAPAHAHAHALGHVHTHAHPVAGPSGVKSRRSATNYWSSEGGDEQEHPQQHGWIVGDSHKKLVTMLAHAKGRKRSDDKRHLVE